LCDGGEALRHQSAKVRLSKIGELPGFDFEYEDRGVRNAVEVKGTTCSFFPSIELTINEWRAAEEYGDRFWLYLVAKCDGPDPRVEIIRDPASLIARQAAAISPVVLRFELRAQAAEVAGV
jgi:hypothetical protein